VTARHWRGLQTDLQSNGLVPFFPLSYASCAALILPLHTLMQKSISSTRERGTWGAKQRRDHVIYIGQSEVAFGAKIRSL
jgi:hypothetical protein